MPLSTDKLDKLLSLKGFVTNKYFVIDNNIVYMEIVSISTADAFLLYIPSKYNFPLKKANNVYKLKYIDVDDTTTNTADDYAGKPDEYDVENKYQEIDINASPSVKDRNIASHLEESYKRVITLKDISTDDQQELGDLVRQLKRFRFCVQNVKYKIAIIYKNYLCCIKRDDSVECFSIKKFRGKDSKSLYITADLELLYEKMDSLLMNMSTIKKGLYHILDKNHFTHTKTLEKLLIEKNDVMTMSDNAYSKKIEYETHLKDANDMLKTINKSERSLLNKIREANGSSSAGGSLNNDIERSHVLAKLNTDLDEVQRTKNDIIKTIFELKAKRENAMLNVDKIMFDNTVMIDCVLRNFSKLGEIR